MLIGCKCLNEEKTVKRVIGDFHDEPWVDKIIAIDGDSSDYTVQELRQFSKVDVYVHKYLDWYHDQEIMQANIVLSYIPHNEIVFLLDFDERITQPLKEVLSKINEAGEMPDGADLVHIPRRTIDVLRYENSPFAILGRDGWPMESHEIGQFPDYQPRLIRKTHKMHWVQSPHRALVGWIQIAALRDECHILHYEKDDYRDREWIERRWLRQNAKRISLGLPCDLYEVSAKPEFADAIDPNYWKGER